MAIKLSVGDEAPNFDLTSTEDVLLMLRDEVVRTPVLLYFFGGVDDDRARADLLVLARSWEDLTARGTRALALSSAKIQQLKELQAELHLPFPLLSDDRGFSRSYGVEPDDDGASEPALVAVNRRQQIIWIANPVASVESSMDDVQRALEALPSQTVSLPKAVVNRLIDRWVN